MRGPFDSSTKAFYRALFGGWGLAVEAELEVFARGRTIDLAVQCGEEDFGRLGGTCFDHFRFLNAIEFKGPEDPLTVPDYNRVMMRAWGLGALGLREGEGDGSVVSGPDAPTRASRKPSYPFPWDRTLTIVCVTRPDSILGNRGYGFRPTERPGVYHQGGPLPQWIIHPARWRSHPATTRSCRWHGGKPWRASSTCACGSGGLET